MNIVPTVTLKQDWDYQPRLGDPRGHHASRHEEQAAVADFVERRDEGSLLVVGRRGSGKTSLPEWAYPTVLVGQPSSEAPADNVSRRDRSPAAISRAPCRLSLIPYCAAAARGFAARRARVGGSLESKAGSKVLLYAASRLLAAWRSTDGQGVANAATRSGIHPE